jgi:hypothetical protein
LSAIFKENGLGTIHIVLFDLAIGVFKQRRSIRSGDLHDAILCMKIGDRCRFGKLSFHVAIGKSHHGCTVVVHLFAYAIPIDDHVSAFFGTMSDAQ